MAFRQGGERFIERRFQTARELVNAVSIQCQELQSLSDSVSVNFVSFKSESSNCAVVESCVLLLDIGCVNSLSLQMPRDVLHCVGALVETVTTLTENASQFQVALVQPSVIEL